MYNTIFLKKLFQKLVVHIFALLLAPFVSKLVNYSRHSESLKYVWKRSNHCFLWKVESISNSSESLKSPCASNNWSIWTQKVPKEAQRFTSFFSCPYVKNYTLSKFQPNRPEIGNFSGKSQFDPISQKQRNKWTNLDDFLQEFIFFLNKQGSMKKKFS